MLARQLWSVVFVAVAVGSPFWLMPRAVAEDDNRRTIYEWTDAAGGVHYTADPSQIPADRRDSVRERKMARGTPTAPAAPAPTTADEDDAAAAPEPTPALAPRRDPAWWRTEQARLVDGYKRAYADAESSRFQLNVARERGRLGVVNESLASYQAAAAEARRIYQQLLELPATVRAQGGSDAWLEPLESLALPPPPAAGD